MTHDELLEKLVHTYAGPIYHALRAVVELHKPHSGLNGNTCTCDPYDEYRMGYPCETIEAIEKELE